MKLRLAAVALLLRLLPQTVAAAPPIPSPPAEPPVAEPPVAEPPVAEPPVAQPPVAEPPVAEPPVAQPPPPQLVEPPPAGEYTPADDERPSSDPDLMEEEQAKAKATGRKLEGKRPKAQTGRGAQLRVDVSAAALFRNKTPPGTAEIFAGAARGSVAMRGAYLVGDAWYRAGFWLGYRFEPGFKRRLFESDSSQGVHSWMMAHDLTVGVLGDLTAHREAQVAFFTRVWVGGGVSFTTLQIESLDDGHLYSQTTPTHNFTATLDWGVRVANRFEAFAGLAGLMTGDASLSFKQSDADFETQPMDLAPVNRSGGLLYAGLGLEF